MEDLEKKVRIIDMKIQREKLKRSIAAKFAREARECKAEVMDEASFRRLLLLVC